MKEFSTGAKLQLFVFKLRYIQKAIKLVSTITRPLTDFIKTIYAIVSSQ